MTATANQVQEITGSTLATEVIRPFIDAAGVLMRKISENTADMSDADVCLTEAYLAAHLMTTSKVGKGSSAIKRESLRGKYTAEYLMPSGMGDGVLSTQFGVTANMMSGGYLAQLGKTPVGLFAIGTIGS